MARYKVTTAEGTFLVTTEDSPETGGATSADAAMPMPAAPPPMGLPRPAPSAFEVSRGTSSTPNVAPGSAGPDIMGKVRALAAEIGTDRIKEALGVALSPVPQARDLVTQTGGLFDVATDPAKASEMASPAFATMGALSPVPGGAAMGSAAGKLYEKGVKKLTGSDRPSQATFFGMDVPRVPGVQADVSDVVVEGLLGGLPEGAAKTIIAALKLPSTKFGQKMASAVFGPDSEAIAERMARPEAIKNAPTFSQIADDLPDALTELEKKLKAADADAWKVLSKTNDPAKGAIPKTDIVKVLKEVRRAVQVEGGGAIGPAQKKAVATIDSIIDDIQGIGKNRRGNVPSEMGASSGLKKSDFISEAQMRGTIQGLRESVNYADGAAGATNDALMKAAAQLDDVLKTRNTAYAEMMGPVAEMTDLFDKLKTDFSIKSKPGKGLIRTDATKAKVQGVLSDRKDVSRAELEKLGEKTGRNIKQTVGDATTAAQFKGGRIQGSRRVNLAGGVGAGLGSIVGLLLGNNAASMAAGAAVGGVAGPMAGAYIDKEGGPIVAKLIDAYLARNPANLTHQPFAGSGRSAVQEILDIIRRQGSFAQ